MCEKTSENRAACGCGGTCGSGCGCEKSLLTGVKKLALYRNMGGERWKIHPETGADQVRLGDGSDLQTRLNTLEAAIGDIQDARHSHANRAVLDALGINGGRLSVNGAPVCDGLRDIAVVAAGQAPPADLRNGGVLIESE